MRKSISLVLICICLACSGCANGYISQDNTSRDITESSGIVEHSVNADEQAEEYVIVDFDDHINLLTPSDVHNTVNQTREESLLGIAYSVPSDWINGSDMIKDNYIGRQYYKDSTIEKDWYIEICYAGLEEGALGTDKAIERLIEGAKSIEDVSSFSSSETVVDNTDAYYYSCYYERKYYEDAYAIPIGDYGILCLFYDRISNDTDIETEFSQLIESIKIPDIDYVRSNYTSCVNTVYDGVTDKDPAEASGEVFDSEPENEPDTEKPSSSNSERDGFDDTLHSYYTGISAEGASEADAVAKQIAGSLTVESF